MAQAFLATVRTHGPELTTGRKGNWVALYQKFLESRNFAGWLKQKRSEATDRLRRLYLEKLCVADVPAWCRGKHELELIDLLMRLREELVREPRAARSRVRDGWLSLLAPPWQTRKDSQRILNETMSEQLGKHIATILQHLPSDLRDSLQVA